jgi:biotin-dependent carboxylase-like uncharacterized protein
MSGLRITKSGILTQIQDSGRVGYGDIGITQSGIADRYSGAWANRLLFNSPDAPLLEILLGGVTLVAEVDSVIALTGAEALLRINGFSKPLWRTHPVQKGDTIEIGMASSGLRLYLAVKGGFGCVPMLGSCATTLKEGLGSKVEDGDLLPCECFSPSPSAATPHDLIPQYLDVVTLRVLLGYQSDLFSPAQRRAFFSTPYQVTQATDRMGCRLQGEAVTYEGGELISEPIAYGSIQIPADGQPIILLNERQTIGGYPKIGSVIPMDCYRLAQARPGTTVAFKEIGLEEAVRVTRELMGFVAIS